MAKVFLFGSSGFVGSAVGRAAHSQQIVTDRFSNRGELDALRSAPELRAEIRRQVILADPDVILNCANHFSRGHLHSELAPSISVNSLLPTVIQSVAFELQVPFYQIGSYWQLPHFRTIETLQSTYLSTKLLGSELLKSSQELWQVTGEILISDTWGRNDSRDKLIPRLLAHARDKENLPFNLAAPRVPVHLINVDDLAATLLSLIQQSSNLGSSLLILPQFSARVFEIAEALGVEWCSNSKAGDEEDYPALELKSFSDEVQNVPPQVGSSLDAFSQELFGKSL